MNAFLELLAAAAAVTDLVDAARVGLDVGAYLGGGAS